VVRRTRRRLAVVLVALARVTLLLLAFHLSGLAHLAVDIHEIVTTGHHAGTPFDEDDDAPPTPGSPSSHHAQAGGAPLASAARLDLSVDVRVAVVAVPTVRTEAPPMPPRRTLYRPPRA
jgi:hypothetical protein